MAAVSVQLSPHVLHSMTNRRPLANIANVGNSPYRPAAAAAAATTKRSRSHSNAAAAEHTMVQPPPKRQVLEASNAPVTPRKGRAESRANPVTPTQRPHAARTREAIRTQRQEHLDESMEKLRQWQKHNEKTFPSYVFFFENVPENARRECIRGVRALGAGESLFFSKSVTHVITTRAIPAEEELNTPVDAPSQHSPRHDKAPPKTIDPSVLEKDRSIETLASLQKSKFTFEAPRKPLALSLDGENRNVQQSDILLRAKSMGIKIWGLDKLRRILDVMFDDGVPGNPTTARGRVSNIASKAPPARQDLQQLISNEQLNGPTDRDAKGVYNETTSFKGPYLYVRCCFERVKPIMVREWPKVANRDDGEWPQFRSVSSGKCPFVEEDRSVRKSATKTADRGANRLARGATKEEASTKRPSPADAARMDPPALLSQKRPLLEIENHAKPASVPQQLPPQCKNEAASSRPGTSHGPAFVGRSGLVGGEPMASGMQASNVTSAIRSQAISSTAAAPGAKAGTSREMHGLQRKVLGRAQGPPGKSLSRSPAMVNLAELVGGDVASRTAKQRGQEKPGHSRLSQVLEGPVEDETDEPDTECMEVREKAAALNTLRRKAGREKREPKPGFCENCREKFDDFEEHTVSKRHRRFAANKENWTELDDLLALLGRPQLRTYS